MLSIDPHFLSKSKNIPPQNFSSPTLYNSPNEIENQS